MGAGACYLVEKHPEIEKRFKDGEEIILWDNYDELAVKVKFLLQDANEYKQIGVNAYARCFLEHSVSVRTGQFIELMENL
jgi:spore maturation protein CgeB